MQMKNPLSLGKARQTQEPYKYSASSGGGNCFDQAERQIQKTGKLSPGVGGLDSVYPTQFKLKLMHLKVLKTKFIQVNLDFKKGLR